MKQLLVFDSSIVMDKIIHHDWTQCAEMHLFSLLSRGNVSKKIEKTFTEKNISVQISESADFIDKSAQKIRAQYMKLLAEIPHQITVGRKNLKEWLALDETMSMWWLSLVAEKNTLKSKSFHRLAQLDAIIHVIQEKNIERIVFACGDNKLKKALMQYASAHSILMETVPTRPLKGLKRKLDNLQEYMYIKHIFLLFRFALVFFLRTLKIKWSLKKFKRDTSKRAGLLTVTYYPVMDMKSAQKGIFKNKYCTNMQEQWEKEGKTIFWVAIFVENGLLSLKQSLDYAKAFIKNGTMIFFLEEFNSIGIQIKSLMRMIVCGIKFLRIEPKISKSMSINGYDCYPIFKDDWYTSFVGTTGYLNMMYYYMWQSMIKCIPAEKCLYCCEMHAWEKALLSANNRLGHKMTMLAYQNSTVSRMLLNYFNDPSEVGGNGNYAIPRSDKIICNGEVPINYMRESGWPQDMLATVEAVRYNHLKKYLNKRGEKRNIVLLVFSLSVEESSALLSVVREAFSNISGIEVWIKSHPFLLIEKVFEFAEIAPKDLNFEVKDQSIEELLSQARVVIAGQSGVSFEALAFGCEVISVNTPEQVNMSPLKNIESDLTWNVSSSQALRKIVEDIIGRSYDAERQIREARKVIDQCFCLNENSDQPDRFLEVLESAHA